MSNGRDRPTKGNTSSNNLQQLFASELRLSRLHRLFKSNYNVTEPSVILEPYLYLGNCISAHDVHHLAKLGVHYVLNVAIRDVEVCPYYNNEMRTLSIDLRDDDRENILRTFDQAFAFIDEAKRNKSRVLVHCSHGQSRSPAIVIAYLMRTYNVSLEQCLIHVIKARPCVLPNDGFLKQLMFYDRFLIDRRRQREAAAAAAAKSVEKAPQTEIPVQHHEPPPLVAPPVEKTPIPIPIAPIQTASKPGSISSVDLSHVERQRSTLPSSTTSVDSIHVIPIQVVPKKPQPDKISESIPMKKPAVEEAKVVEEKKKIPRPSPEEPQARKKPAAEPRSSHQAVSSARRSGEYTTSAVGRTSTQASRPHSINGNRLRGKHTPVSAQSYISSSEPWKDVIYHATNYRTPMEQKTRTKYITEIYDKATNRFIPIKF